MRLAHTLALAFLAGAASLAPASAATRRVPQQYTTIQAALNAAREGDTVLVSPKTQGADRTYHEALTIATPSVTLQGKNGATLNGAGLGNFDYGPDYYVGPDGIDIKADHVAVRDLTVQNFAGSQFSDNAAIAVGFFADDFSGFTSASDIEISGCTIRNNHKGVSIIGYNGPNPFFDDGTGTVLKGYRLLNDTVTNNADDGAQVWGRSVLVAGSKFAQNGLDNGDGLGSGDGLDVSGSGLAVTGNEFAANGNQGVSVGAALYDASVNSPQNPAPSVVGLNSIHDNGGYGLAAGGTLLITGNSATRNAGYGIYLANASGTVALNSSTHNVALGTPEPGDPYEAGVGIYVDYTADIQTAGADTFFDPSDDAFTYLPLLITANQAGGNASDGISLNEADKTTVSRNVANGNGAIGIHVSASAGFDAPNLLTLNTAQNNGVFDAQDDVRLAGGPATANVWTRNTFGTANPPSLKN